MAFSFHSMPVPGVSRGVKPFTGTSGSTIRSCPQSMNSSQCLVGVAASTCAEIVGRQVRGEGHGAGLGHAGEPHPARDAADAQQVGHHVVAGAHLDGRLADAPAPPVLADLDGRGELGRKPRLACRSRRRRRAPRSRPGPGRRWRGRCRARSPTGSPWLKSNEISTSGPTALRTAL